MAKYRKLPVVIEAITFDELVQLAKDQGANEVNGMPWSFSFHGQPITHENDDCYLIATLEGVMKFNRGDMLIIGTKNEIYPCKMDIFEKIYKPEGNPTELIDGAHYWVWVDCMVGDKNFKYWDLLDWNDSAREFSNPLSESLDSISLENAKYYVYVPEPGEPE